MKLLLFILAVSPAWGGVLPRADPPVEFRVADESSVVPDHYMVSLETGHALSEHWKAIGRDLSRDGEDFYYMEGINSYGVTLRDANIVHNAIRTDTKVKFVESRSTTPSLLSISYTLSVSIIIKRRVQLISPCSGPILRPYRL
jgi:hypothetical protein